MTDHLLMVLGGLGLFLIGIRMMTDGLRALAGRRLRDILQRNTATPLRGAVSGALTTAMVQSSSATTVAVVGFVGAGLMAFPQALGIILGANIGTTITGWMVALIGFKLQLGTALMPVALLGVLMRMFARGGWRDAGWALAGFSVLFFGIDALQQGMGAFGDILDQTRFPADTALGRLQLVGLGVVVTIVTQSSSAGVASALAALGAGAITFPQAAALVIGMDVGTTVSAALATLGGSTAARRTGFAHVLFNIGMGSMAFCLLWPLGWLIAWLGDGYDPQIALVAFHTGVNTLGVVLVLGVTDRFAWLVMRLVPDHRPGLVARLDPRLQEDPAAAIDATAATVRDIAGALFDQVRAQVSGRDRPGHGPTPEAVTRAIGATQDFLHDIRPGDDAAVREDQLACLHALDHLERLRLRALQTARIDTLRTTPGLHGPVAALASELAPDRLSAQDTGAEEAANDLRKRLRVLRETYRDAVFEAAIGRKLAPVDVAARSDAVRWLQRVSYHVWRIQHHLRSALTEGRRPPDRDVEARAETED